MSDVIVEDTASSGGKSGLYFRKPEDGKFYLRFYPLKWINEKGESVERIGKVVRFHFDSVNKKRIACTSGCSLCKKGEKATVRQLVGCVDAKNSIDKMQLYEMPISAWKLLKAQYDTNGSEIFGDSGITFEVKYTASAEPASKYSMAPVLKDKRVFTNASKLLCWDPEQVESKKEENLSEKESEDLFGTSQVEKDITPKNENLV
jgi:hypothetical protein